MKTKKNIFGVSRLIKACVLPCLIAALGAGCATQTKFLQSKQNNAIQTAESRAQFEFNCQDVSAKILSREVVQPAIEGPWASGIQRAEYTVGVTGCGKRGTLVVLCPEGGESCFATSPGRFTQEKG